MEVAREAAENGAKVIRKYYDQGVTIRNKGDYDLVADADVESEQVIVDTIRAAFPDHAVLAEESHRDDVTAPHLWVVDPLDGTNNFAHHVPHFAVSIAYYEQGVAQCGVVLNPIREDLYEVARGQGATRDGVSIQVGEQTKLSEVLVGVGFYYDRGRMMEATLDAVRDLFGCGIHGIRRFGTAALDLCQVACGMYGAFFEYELSPWDFGAGRLFVEEAGGQVTTCRGDALGLTKSSLLASNGSLHPAVLEIVNRHHPPEPPA